MARQLTVRGVSDEVDQRLKTLSRAKGESVNTVVLKILEAAVGVDRRQRRLQRYATWSKEDLAEFERTLQPQRVIDEELWN